MVDFGNSVAQAFAFLEARGLRERREHDAVVYENGRTRVRISLDRGPEVVVTFQVGASKFDFAEVAGLFGCEAPGLMGDVEASLLRAAAAIAVFPDDAFAMSPAQVEKLSSWLRAASEREELKVLRARIARSRSAGTRAEEIELLAELGADATPAEAARLHYLRRLNKGA